PVLAIGELGQVAELAEDGVIAAGGIRLVSLPVADALDEQEPRRESGVVPFQPVLLFPDDRSDLAVHQDGVGGDVDLALGVAEPAELPALAGRAGGRGEAVLVAGADLA